MCTNGQLHTPIHAHTHTPKTMMNVVRRILMRKRLFYTFFEWYDIAHSKHSQTNNEYIYSI